MRSKAFVEPVLLGEHDIVVPSIFVVEVVAALSRAGIPRAKAFEYSEIFLCRASVVRLGPKGARRASRIAEAAKLRGMDAIYVWVAQREGIPLVTLNRELSGRTEGLCEVIIP